MVNKAACPLGRAWRTRCWLSGDQFQAPTRGPPKDVNFCGLEPSASAIQISSVPDRLEPNASFLPSGE
jgi:hypothetical protein